MPSSPSLPSAHRNSVQLQWADSHLLGLNALSYGDGRVTLLRIYTVRSDQTEKFYAFPVADTTIEGIVKYDDDLWTEIQLHGSQIIVGDTTFRCGEGAMGNEGFVAATNADGLLWTLFSTASNPFQKLEVVGIRLKAYSDCQVYSINLENLTDIKVQAYDMYSQGI
ncbi:hypothetical protein QMK33_18935 [Hymenobacter sp. H14-R3]|uniref:hypothetical protein n=1 Tax=Hymenobacter sp. H14-R3 TaxID=3046308 RepID=UPI0024BA33EF|nr:hypothetical protein [Hymenobacter sp. H14-R3]MDJ0367229.1 hypothetical protein [Hymenobacter sp. H14-R3]